MLTSRDSDLDYQIAMEFGCDGFFVKPTSPMNIVSRVKSIFRRLECERLKYVENPAETVKEAYADESKRRADKLADELRTPLMSIKSHAEGIKQGLMDTDSAATTIIEATDRLAQLVDDVLQQFNT
jgi:signal transduction histidine kinase